MNKVFIFLLGAGIGSLVTWKIIDEKYKRIADEEIESVIEHYKEKEKNNTSVKITSDGIEIRKDEKVVTSINAPETPWGPDPSYKEIISPYTSSEDEDDYVVETEPQEESIAPYVISPEEFGEFGNKTVSLMYYADGILADDDDVIVSDPENVIGDALSHFGEYEDDAVHVRDENTETDYEILLSEKTFDEILHKEGN